MKSYVVSTSPHITSQESTRTIMADVLIALAPAVVAAVFFFGYHVIINLVFTAAFCWGFETLYNLITNKAFTKSGFRQHCARDLSCFVTAVILALNLPAVTEVWGLSIKTADGAVALSFDTIIVCLIGSLVAIVLVKQLFGGIGRNFANPALTARVFLFLAFATAFTPTQTLGIGFQASTGATWLSGYKSTGANEIYNLFIGNIGSAAVGETCVIALLLGYLYLSIRKVIDFRVPLMIIGWSAVFAILFDGLGKSDLAGAEIFKNAAGHVMSGGLIFGSVFMATDYATSPNTFIGNCVYCFGIALLTMLIRVFASYPEGMSFALLIMNCVVPLIDKFIYPRPFGYIKPERKNRAKEESK